ncbi:MAG: ABC transporter permease [Proteobacteria bacterium]|nr:ABC transporter permease [Pseudomonadota bacterium]
MSERRPVAFRGGGFSPVPVRGAALVAFVALVAFWEFAVRTGRVSAIFLPAPSAVLAALSDLWQTGTLWRHVSESLVRLAGGWTLGTMAGLAAGLSMGVWSLGRAVGVPFVSALFPIPKISLLPLLILWLGIGEASKIATIGLGVFFPTAIATYAAIDAVPRNLIRMAQSFDMPASDVLRKIVLPGALPGILAGFRISTSIALILLVSAEMIGAEYGIGAFILQAGNLMLTDQLIAGVLLISILGLAVGTGLTRLEKRLLRWR